MQQVLKKANYSPQQDKLILLGNYIDRGNELKSFVATVKEFVANGAIALLANHEKFMIDFLENEDCRLWIIVAAKQHAPAIITH
jgi:serine/threonine protein phosphatase 1